VGDRVTLKLLVVMDVQHQIQAPAQNLLDGGIDSVQECRGNRERGLLARVSRPAHRKPDGVEAGLGVSST